MKWPLSVRGPHSLCLLSHVGNHRLIRGGFLLEVLVFYAHIQASGAPTSHGVLFHACGHPVSPHCCRKAVKLAWRPYGWHTRAMCALNLMVCLWHTAACVLLQLHARSEMAKQGPRHPNRTRLSCRG